MGFFLLRETVLGFFFCLFCSKPYLKETVLAKPKVRREAPTTHTHKTEGQKKADKQEVVMFVFMLTNAVVSELQKNKCAQKLFFKPERRLPGTIQESSQIRHTSKLDKTISDIVRVFRTLELWPVPQRLLRMIAGFLFGASRKTSVRNNGRAPVLLREHLGRPSIVRTQMTSLMTINRGDA